MEVSVQLKAPATLSPGMSPTGAPWIVGWMGPRATLNYVKRKALEGKTNRGLLSETLTAVYWLLKIPKRNRPNTRK
jgi:hypothetical protein